MPTTRPRLTITETDEVAAALDAAARRWPEEKGSRSRLLVRLVDEWRRRADDDERVRLEERRRAIAETAGSATGLFPPGYPEELRKDWPD